jgi:hypothetical protein
MNLIRMILAIAFCLACAVLSPVRAAPVSPISPGDIVFVEFFKDWHKLDPATGQVTEIAAWNATFPSVFSSSVQTIAFDVDGAVLYDQSSGIYRLNPLTGAVTPVRTFFGGSSPAGFLVESDGNLLLADGLTGISRYSRATQALSTIVPATANFSPRGIVRGPDGRIFVTDPTANVLEVDLASGTTSPVTNFRLTGSELIASRSDGKLLVESKFMPDGLYLIDPDTGATTLFANDQPIFTHGFAFDSNQNLWVTGDPDGLIKYGSGGGSKIPIYDATFFSPGAIVMVPLDWTPPPVPEPATIVLVLLAGLAWLGLGRR